MKKIIVGAISTGVVIGGGYFVAKQLFNGNEVKVKKDRFKGETILITGANTGLGLITTKEFAKRGAKVIMVCRNVKRGEIAVENVKKEVPDAELELMTCDLGITESVIKFSNEVKNKGMKIDVFINNAAVMKVKRTMSDDGMELMFKVNFVSQIYLMNSLIEFFKRWKTRVINIGLPPERKIDIDDLQFAKNMVFSKKIEGSGVKIILTDSGKKAFRSNLVRDGNFIARFFKNYILSGDPIVNARNLCYFADEKSINDCHEFQYYGKDRKIPPPLYTQDETTNQKIYDIGNEFLRKYYRLT